jgi:DNA-binding transcriptional ArsR family regulator
MEYMSGDADLARAAGLMAEPARAKVLMALADGRALPASLLASEAGVSPQTVSGHLRKLLDGGLVAVERSGRHRYYKLSGPEVAAAVEALARIAKPQPIKSLRQSTRAAALREARTCYDHLAGELGVSLLDALRRERLVRTKGSEVELTTAGRERLEALGVDLTPTRRAFTRLCLDWSERRYHLAGALGAAITQRLFELDWIERGSGRTVRLTPQGRTGLLALGLQS